MLEITYFVVLIWIDSYAKALIYCVEKGKEDVSKETWTQFG